MMDDAWCLLFPGDFKPRFRDDPDLVYSRSSEVAEAPVPHAVVLVGYDNNREFWIAKNSWGVDFANKGFFKVSFKSTFGNN